MINESIKIIFLNLLFDRSNFALVFALVFFFFIFDDRWININIINIININIININNVNINNVNINNVDINNVDINNVSVNNIFFIFIFFIFIFFIFTFFIFSFDVSFTINLCLAKNDKSCRRFKKLDQYYSQYYFAFENENDETWNSTCCNFCSRETRKYQCSWRKNIKNEWSY